MADLTSTEGKTRERISALSVTNFTRVIILTAGQSR